MSNFFKWERRDYKAKKESYTVHLLLAILFFLFALAYSADKFGLTNVAKAEMPHVTEKEACQSIARGFEGKGISDSEIIARCGKLGVKITKIKHY